MSPKKSPRKKNGDQKKSKAKKKKNDEGGAVGSRKLTELDKEIFNIQIRDLEDKLKRCQEKLLDAQVERHASKLRLDQLSVDKKDVVEFLRRNLDQRTDEVAELHERLEGLLARMDTDGATHSQLVQQMKVQFQETKDQLTSENIVLSGKLASLKEFKAQKEELMGKMESLKAELKRKEEEHVEAMRLAEREHVLELDRLKGALRTHVEDVAREFRRVSHRQMEETTRRALQENALLVRRTQALTDKVEAATEERGALQGRIAEKNIKIASLEGLYDELTKRNSALKKININLEEKVSELELLMKESCHMKEELGQKEEQLAHAQTELDTYKQNANSAEMENGKLKGENKRMVSKLKEAEQRTTTLEALFADAAEAIRIMLKQNKESTEESSSPLLTIDKDGVLSHVICVLNEDAMTSLHKHGLPEEDVGLVPRSENHQ